MKESENKRNNFKKAIIALALTIFVVIMFVAFQNGGQYKEYTEIIEGNPTVLYIAEPSCSDCNKLLSVIKDVAKEYDGKVNIIYYSSICSEFDELDKKYNIKAMPALIYLNGEDLEVDRVESCRETEDIKAKLIKLNLVTE